MKAIMTGTLAAGFDLAQVLSDDEAESRAVRSLTADGELLEMFDVQDPTSLGRPVKGVSADGGIFVVLGLGLRDGFSVWGPFEDDESAETFGENFRTADQEWQVFSVNHHNSTVPVDHFTEILQHRVKFWLRGEDAPEALDDCSVEHVTKLIGEGYREGELCVIDEDGETEYRGWWSIQLDG